jgi:hypothetical protein
MYDNLKKLAATLTPTEYISTYGNLPKIKPELPVRHQDIQDAYKSDFSRAKLLQDQAQLSNMHVGPRAVLMEAMHQQATDPHVRRRLMQYKGSPVAQQLLRERHPDPSILRYSELPKQVKSIIPKTDAMAVTNVGGRYAYVPHHLRHTAEYPERNFYKWLGYEGLSNHELEHLNNQFLDVTAKNIDVANQYHNATNVTDISGTNSDPIRPRAFELKQQLRQYVKDFISQRMLSGYTSEIAPAVGDLLFMGERYAREHGYNPAARKQLPEVDASKLRNNYPALMEMAKQKPDPRLLQHTVEFPGGKKHDINWMRDQAHQHGYFKGQGIDPLIFDTPEGRQWFMDMMRHRSKYTPSKSQNSSTKPITQLPDPY